MNGQAMDQSIGECFDLIFLRRDKMLHVRFKPKHLSQWFVQFTFEDRRGRARRRTSPRRFENEEVDER